MPSPLPIPEPVSSETTVNATREALLDAAEDLFSRRGYASVGIREIAERAGANLAAIRYHLGSKHELYLETVRRVMARGERGGAWAQLAETPADTRAAARLLARFVHDHLTGSIADGRHQSCSALMLWEVLQPTEAIDAVVRDYIRPGHEALVALVQRAAPDGETDAALHARSLLAQLLYYRIFRSFIERLSDPDAIDGTEVARHVTRTTLRAMGHGETFIDDALT